MKRIVFVTSVLSGLILSSCATNNVASNGLIQKRKHNKGFHLNFPSKVSDSESKESITSNDVKSPAVEYVAEVLEEASTPVIVRDIVQSDAPDTSVETETEVITAKNDILIAPRAEKKRTTKAVNVVTQLRKNRSAESDKASDLGINQNYNKKNDAQESGFRADTVLLVILCFLLPPLAVYLYEGSWTSRCTVNLILTLLCGLPGVIHGLIVVLG